MEIEWAIPMASRIMKIIRSIALWFCVTIGTVVVHAEALGNDCVLTVARFVSIQGVVEFYHAGELGWRPAELNAPLCVGDRVRVRSRSRAALRLSNESMLRLDQKSAITFVGPVGDQATVLELMSGAIHVITRTPKPFKVRTPIVNASVDGTEFFIGVRPSETRIVVYEGQVNAANAQGSLVLTDGESVVVQENQPLRKEIMLQPLDAVHWALYYPTLIDNWFEVERKDQFPQSMKNVIDSYHQGRLKEALTELDRLIDKEPTITLLIYRAGLQLMVGRAEEAHDDLQQVLRMDPGNSDVLALQAVMAITQGRKDEALNFAKQAVESSPTSSLEKLALSYAQQAHFQIEAALASVEDAVQFDQLNALAWARLAELQMSLGQLNRALQSAEQAVKLNPDLSKTQTVLGFAHLLQIDTRKAQATFSKAVSLDQADPMPRLGMGIALVREGKLEAGRINIEIAASLDPANSLVRSYLGKAYFEEKRYPMAGIQFDLAKARDPNDPTPWFYDAIQKQTQNRPVEALRDIQKSIELNDNRAVYRSQFLLDQDQAARGSSLARIYENLGFERRALMETAKSLSFDPTNHSAHRFLSDTYLNIPRHEIARVSELLQAQLLQPINVNPVQPRMAVADLNIITGTGPAALGFNEFAPLMERNKAQLVAEGMIGNQGIFGDEIVFSKLYDRTSVSLGQFHFQNNGFRKNNDQRHNIFNAFVQHAFTPKFNAQAELRTREIKHGDIESPRFFSKIRERSLKEDSARMGARYEISPRQDIIVSSAYAHNKTVDENEFGEISTKNHRYQTETQYHLRKKYFNLIAGGGISRFESDFLTRYKSPSFESESDILTRQNNAYIYSNWNLLKDFIATLGLSYNSYQVNEKSIDLPEMNKFRINKLNPKLGLQLNVIDEIRLRLAWFENVKSDLIGQQTIEPTQVAGFNQFFDDPNGTQTRRKGVGLDARISEILYIGLEASERKIKLPMLISQEFLEEFLSCSRLSNKQKEQIFSSYVYGIVSSKWSVTGELVYEIFSRDKHDQKCLNEIGPTEVRTLSFPLSIDYFNPNGLFSRFIGTFVNQDFSRSGMLNSEADREGIEKNSGSSKFFLVDFVAGYRFLSRRGLLSFEVKNILNKDFYFRNPQFQNSIPVQPFFLPTRTFIGRLSLNF